MREKGLSARLFTEFPPVSATEWEAQINKDLKGADYEKKLIWKTMEGFQLRPYYRAEDLVNISHLDDQNSDFLVLQENKRFLIRHDIEAIDIKTANLEARNAINGGVTSIGFAFNHDCNLDRQMFSDLLEGIDISAIELNFVLCTCVSNLLSMLVEEFKDRGLDAKRIRGSVDFDPLGYLSLHGNYSCKSDVISYQIARTQIEYARMFVPAFRVLTVNGQHFHNCGSGIVQELAFSLAIADEYITSLSEPWLPETDILPRIRFNFAAGSDYFMEIAKLRAARLLWKRITNAYLPDQDIGIEMNIHSVTSRWNKTVYDPYVNMLRDTTGAMSAIIGGADSLTIEAFIGAENKQDDFSDRIARNISLICKEEAYLDKVLDPAAGSYYIETLTESIINESWKLFLQVIEMGGYTESLKTGFIQHSIREMSMQRDMNIAMRKEILLGTNQYPARDEKAGTRPGLPFKEINADNERIVEPLHMYRGAQSFEELRMKTELSGKNTSVFLLTFGNLALQRARANFSANFFACAGFTIIENDSFTSIDEGIDAALKSNAAIVVACSSDEEYADAVPVIFEKLKKKSIVVVAGYPQNLLEKFGQLGLNHYIHIRSNILETLTRFQQELGIL
ncbi:MAG: methylmalonyl-CoA mutase family protein [Bacteroidia bacterium]|nr:methylmalonyl-CoA mutase family protein [Bacteroidia bacterium]